MSAKKASVKKVSGPKKSAKKPLARKPAAKKTGKSKKPKIGSKKRALKVATKKVATKSTGKTRSKKSLAKKSIVKKAVLHEISRPSVALRVGDQAPDFSLLNQHGQTVALKDFVGRQNVVLYFYPKAMTPGCTVQACGIRDAVDKFREARAIVLGVSPDKLALLVKFQEHDQLNFDLLSDENKEVAKRYGAWGPKKFMGREFMGVRRWTFIIGKDGRIKHIMDQVNTQTHHDDVLAVLKTL